MRFKAIVFLVLAGVAFAAPAFGYGDKTTHPALTDEVVDFYNLFADRKIASEEKEWIIQGVADEDTPPRWINHFYDPINKEGWKGENTGVWPKSVVRSLSDVLLSSNEPVSSLDWMHDQRLQKKYERYKGNRTWERAIYEYLNGNEKEAFYTLGFVLHLMEDATVPAHTRNDTHAHELRIVTGDYGSPYEEYNKRYTRENLRIARKLKEQGGKPNTAIVSVDEFLVALAEYSNKYFFSKDTINDKKYEYPKIYKDKCNDNYCLGLDEKGLWFPVINIKNRINSIKGVVERVYYLPNNDKDSVVMKNYTTHLFRNAIINGAGVIDLFFREIDSVKKGKKTAPKIYKKSAATYLKDTGLFLVKSAYGPINAVLSMGDISIVGEIVKSKTVISSILATVNHTFNLLKNNTPSIKGVDDVRRDAMLADAARPDIVPAGNPAAAADVSVILPPSGGNEAPPAAQSGEEGGNENTVHSESNIARPAVSATEASTSPPAEPPRSDTPSVPLDRLAAAANSKIHPARVSGASSSFFAGRVIGSRKKRKPSEEKKPQKDKPQEKKDEIPPEAPLILSPSDFSKTFTSASITFSGTAEASSTISAFFGSESAATSTGPTGAWSLPLSFGQGSSTIEFFAVDSAGNTSTPAKVSIFIDSKAPDVNLSVAECSDSLSDEACLLATDTLHVSWRSASPDLSFFAIDANGVISTSTATSTIIKNIKDNSSYFFSVSAVDKTGNRSATSTQIVEISMTPIVINEIAWMGTGKKTASDEWIELYNKTDRDINLSGWVLYSETDMNPYIKLSKTISAKGYYLLERTDDDAVKDIAADLVYSGGKGRGAGLSNWGEVLVLSRASTTMERIPERFGSGGGWFSGFPSPSYRTMERVNPNRPGSDFSNWSYNLAVIRNGLSADGKRVNGTPRKRNSVNYLFPIGAKSVHLARKNSPYLVYGGLKMFTDGAVLSVEPGTVIKFTRASGIRFEKGASLKAEGTAELPIVFTSIYDNSVGGEMNTDRVPLPGDWAGININESDSVFKHTSFKYGGMVSWGKIDYSPGCDFCYSNLNISGGKVFVSDSSFENSRRNGLSIKNATSSVLNSSFIGNGSDSDRGAGLHLERSVSIVDSNTFSGNFIGLSVGSGSTTVTFNKFSSSTEEAIWMHSYKTFFGGNSGSGNGINGIRLSGRIAPEGKTTVFPPNPLPYVIKSPWEAFSRASSTIVIPSGAVFKSNAPITIGGKLEIKGEKKDDIIFTSLADDSVGGKTITNPAISKRFADKFGGIKITKGGVLDARGFTARYAGLYNGYDYSDASAFLLKGADGYVSNALFENNYRFGIYASGRSNSLTIRNSVFRGHKIPEGDRSVTAALAVFNGTTTLENVSFEDNSLGVYGGRHLNYSVKDVIFTGEGATTSPGGLW